MNTPVSHPAFHSVLSLLQQQLQKTNEFQQHLNAIKQAITDNQLEQLEGLLGDTSGFFSVFESIKQQLDQLLGQQGYNSETSALEQFVQQHDDTEHQLDRLKTQLDTQLKALEKALLVNDLLVRKNQHRIKQSIRILSGHALSDGPSTYSREGNSDSAATGQKTLARA